MLSPAPARALIARNWADCPDEVATAATPPSRAAIRFSKTSYRRKFLDVAKKSDVARTYDGGVANTRVNMTEGPTGPLYQKRENGKPDA